MLASGVVLGLIVGLLARRQWQPLQSLEIRWLPVLVVGLLARAVAPFAGPLALPLYTVALGTTAAAAACNWRLLGAVAVAVGSALNLAVVLANSGMPVDGTALESAHARMPTDGLHVVLTNASTLAPLADVLPLPLIQGVYSLGDVLIALGGFLVPFLLMIRR